MLSPTLKWHLFLSSVGVFSTALNVPYFQTCSTLKMLVLNS